FIRMRLPPEYRLFPCTTLFRSFVAPDGSIHPLIREALARGVRIDVGRGAHFSFKNAEQVIGAGILPFTIGADLHGYNVRLGDGGDRKSTRLNSSHLGISYAVFC